MRKDCIVIKFHSKLPFWLPLRSRESPHASYPETEAKRCPRRNQRRAAQAVWFDPSRPLPNVIPERAKQLAVVEGVLRRFFQATAAESTIRHVCKAHSEVQAEKGQRVPWKPPG